jgi:hypothetical protein
MVGGPAESPLRESAKEKAGYLSCRLVIHLTQHVDVGVECDADAGMAEQAETTSEETPANRLAVA